MRLNDIMEGLKYKGNINLNAEVKNITSNSKAVQNGFVFVAIDGVNQDGHKYIKEAIENGAEYIVCEKESGFDNQILVDNSRHAYAIMSANFYKNPSKKLSLIGITGTNGKTTTSTIIKQVLEFSGYKVGLIGTIENEIGSIKFSSRQTTPDPMELHFLLNEMVEESCDYVVMEASSHAFAQNRLDGCNFDLAIFSNLTQDHLDYHNTMEEYYKAKKKMFYMCKTAIINYDDEYGQRLINELKQENVDIDIVTYSIKNNMADFTAKNINKDINGVEFAFVGNKVIERIKFCMMGDHSVSNAMAVLTCCCQLGLDSAIISKALKLSKGVNGRTEIISTELGFTVICDYAHTPDGLEKVLSTMKEFTPKRLICLFGCGGNRDKTKRPIMGEVAAELSDFVILTSDNPRNEDPESIIQDVLVGVKKYNTGYIIIPDRYKAIEWAIKNAEQGDVLVLAGKGHEDYQVLSFGTILFDEHQIVKELVEKIKSGG